MNVPYVDQLHLWWHRLPVATHSPVWPGLLATLAFLGLLLAFHQVVRGAVQQGELRRATTAAHAAATWRCAGLGAPGLRERCLAELNAAPRDDAPPQERNFATAAQHAR